MKILLLILSVSWAKLGYGATSPREQRLKALVPELIEQGHEQAYFASIYLMVTQGIRRKINHKEFEQNSCMNLLLDEFLVMYFGALDNPEKAPLAWRVAFETETKPSIHLLLGLNAHISHDLPLSMWRVSQKYKECSPHNIRNDYFALNRYFSDIILELNQELKRTHHRISHNKNNGFEMIAAGTISYYLIYMRRDAWREFKVLYDSDSKPDLYQQIQSIKAKALKRARFYKKLKIISPATGF